MIRSLSLLAVVGFLAGPVAVQAQETYVIKKLKTPVQGETTQVEDEAETATDVKLVDNAGKPLKDVTEKTGKQTVFTETILERKPGAGPAARFRRHFLKERATKNGKRTTGFYEGKTVLYEKEGDFYAFQVESGDKKAGANPRILNTDWSSRADPTAGTAATLPARPVKVGESWKISLEALPAISPHPVSKIDFHREKSTLTGTLTKVYKKDDRQFGVIVYRAELALKSMQIGVGTMTAEPGSKLLIEGTLDGCIDGTSAALSVHTRISLTFETVLPNAQPPKARMTMAVKGHTVHNVIPQ